MTENADGAFLLIRRSKEAGDQDAMFALPPIS
jgi:hypothetical protein